MHSATVSTPVSDVVVDASEELAPVVDPPLPSELPDPVVPEVDPSDACGGSEKQPAKTKVPSKQARRIG